MIAAGISSFNSDNLPFGWFDGVAIVMLIFGLVRGRKNGMAKELLPLFLWLGIVFGGAFGYQPLGQIFINQFHCPKMAGLIYAYLAITFVVFCLFQLLKRLSGKKLTEGNSMFGGSEYYLGMISGLVRYAAVLIFICALLNARFYTVAEINQQQAYNQQTYGGGLKGYSGDFIPTLPEIQVSVFKKSFTGNFIKNQLNILLVDTAPVVKKPAAAPGTHS